MTTNFQSISQELRFSFGKNWQRYRATIDQDRVAEAERSIRAFLGVDRLDGRSFVDIGCGSGLFSLAALRLGAGQVHSFDYDQDSVFCTQEVKMAFRSAETSAGGQWTVERGDILDVNYLQALPQYDIVYSWGVLHHTGKMWQAIENAASLVRPNGHLFIALYNDQGPISAYWKAVKYLYNRSPGAIRRVMEGLYSLYFMAVLFAADVLRLRNPLTRYSGKGHRGMSVYFDVVDWIGGYPFEVARPDAVVSFLEKRGFAAVNVREVGRRHGCNEFVFVRK